MMDLQLGLRGPRLAEGTVTGRDGAALLLRLADGTARRATPAFTAPYRPADGDQLLLIGDGDALYAIGVVAGAGQLDLSVAGDLSLHARGGRLTLAGDDGVSIESPAVSITALRFDVVAERLTEMLGGVMRRVRDLMTVQAGRSSTYVEGHASQHSETAVIAASGTATVSGSQVHLG